MGCCGRKFGRTVRRTTSIFDKIMEGEKLNKYYSSIKSRQKTSLVWTKNIKSS